MSMNKQQGEVIKMYTLPENRDQALQALTGVTKDLLDLADQESQALATSDMLGFAVLQNEKNALADKYAQYSQQFAKRLEEFRGTDSNTLDQLDSLQVALNKKARMNNNTAEQIIERARGKTKDRTMTVEEAAKRVPISWDVQRIAQEQSADQTAGQSEA